MKIFIFFVNSSGNKEKNLAIKTSNDFKLYLAFDVIFKRILQEREREKEGELARAFIKFWKALI